ncbi:hypothetical protein SAMN05216353_101232 [Halobacillus alkaliphilus]|uniref:Uncharacterized protein n=1 Tax=Halobacillus alkaliphilus TaxID=396056 RepID=A0A1I2JKY2_9BACI|nr:hypothetical protein SAMN05216353_101232 [Halobacillus alkaliphilus]
MGVLKLVEAEQGTFTFERPVHTSLTKVLLLLSYESTSFPSGPCDMWMCDTPWFMVEGNL